MVDFSFIVSLYVSDLPNVTISTSTIRSLLLMMLNAADRMLRSGYIASDYISHHIHRQVMMILIYCRAIMTSRSATNTFKMGNDNSDTLMQ